MNSSQQQQIPAPCIQSWHEDSLQTQPGLYPVMHLMVPPPHLCFSFPLLFSMQTKIQTAALSYFPDETFGRVICKNKESFLKSNRAWEGIRTQVFNFTYRWDRIPWNIQSSSVWTRCFPNSQNSVAKYFNDHIFKFLQNSQFSMLFKSTHLSVCNNTHMYFHTIWIFCALPRNLVLSLWRKENLVYDWCEHLYNIDAPNPSLLAGRSSHI